MENGNKSVLIVGISLAICVAMGVAWHFLSMRIEIELTTDFSEMYQSGNIIGARKKAYELKFVDRAAEKFYLANVDISDSLVHPSDRRQLILDAANKLEGGRRFRYDIFKSDYLILRASVSSMLGNRSEAISYATEGCSLSVHKRQIALEPCLRSYYSAPSLAYDVNYSKWDALRLYEWSVLYNSIGTGDKARSRFYEILALRYFDMNKAHALLQEMIKDGLFTPDMERVDFRRKLSRDFHRKVSHPFVLQVSSDLG